MLKWVAMQIDRRELRELLSIVALCVGAAMVYGVAHDQLTARICPEYFTIGHSDLGRPEIFHSDSPTVLGLAWGIVATWWVGLFLGMALAAAARLGGAPKVSARGLLRGVIVVLLLMAVSAFVAGVRGADATAPAWVLLEIGIAAERHRAFMIAWGAHQASYAVGFLGGVGLCVVTLLRRRRAAIL